MKDPRALVLAAVVLAAAVALITHPHARNQSAAAIARLGPAGIGLPSVTRTPTPTPAPALPRGNSELPRGVRVIAEPKGFVAKADVLAGELELPSGRLAIDDFYLGAPQVTAHVPAGRHSVRVTLATQAGQPDQRGRVALATLISADAQPVHWRRLGLMGTDGGTGGFASAEAAKLMADDHDGSLGDRQLDALAAAVRNGVAALRLTPTLNLFSFQTGIGDGGYNVYAGSDTSGRIVRVVVDCGLLHLAWPAPTS